MRRPNFFRLYLLLSLVSVLRGQDTTVWAGAGFGPIRRFPGTWFGSVEVNHSFPGIPIQGWAAVDGSDKGRLLSLGPMVQIGLGGPWGAAVSTGPGWTSQNPGQMLGCRLEFRSSVYIYRRMKGNWQAGLSASHYSNGGISHHNPGAEDIRFLVGYRLGGGKEP